MVRKKSIELLAFSEVYLTAIVGVLIGHCPVGIQAVMPKILSDATLSQSRTKKAELFRHFLLHCTAFASLRLKHLGSHIYSEPNELAGIAISRFKNFVTGSKHFFYIRVSYILRSSC